MGKEDWGGLFNIKEGKHFLPQELNPGEERVRQILQRGTQRPGARGQKCDREAARIRRCSLVSNPGRQDC